MDRQSILEKIAAMLALQESSTFEGEAAAAAEMIDKLCKKYGVTIDEATTPQVLDEIKFSQKRMSEADFVLFCAVARFYDARGYVNYDRSQGRKVTHFKCIGTEAQQIQTQLYYQFIHECMVNECEKAYQAEKVLAELLDKNFTRAGFKTNFYKAFADKVKERLRELKIERGDHEHKEYTAIVVADRKILYRRTKEAGGWGGVAGYDAGSQVSLNKQTGGRQTLALSGS
jgi:hypothetical protein